MLTIDQVPGEVLAFLAGRYLALAEAAATSTGTSPVLAAEHHKQAGECVRELGRRGVTRGVVPLSFEVDRVWVVLDQVFGPQAAINYPREMAARAVARDARALEDK